MKSKGFKSFLSLGLLVASLGTVAPITANAATFSTVPGGANKNTGHWLNQNSHWYFIANGTQATGWKKVNGKWYLFDTNGIMLTGMKQTGGKWYCLGSDGAMMTGWVLGGGKNWYYFNGDGSMKTGWVLWNGHWYYMDTSKGTMSKGWVDYNGKEYFLTSDGSMKTGWLQDGGAWYYMQSDGSKFNPTRDDAVLQIGNKYHKFYAGGKWMGQCQDSTGASYDEQVRLTSPKITAASFSMHVNEGYNPDKFEAKATDCEGKDLTYQIQYEGVVNTLVVGNYPVDLKVTDSHGLSNTFRCYVYVKPAE